MLVATIMLLGALIIAGLAFYAGKLLFLLQRQNNQQQQRRQQRVESISQSIRTIAMAMEQQQCDLSEGCIRICNLLDLLPLQPQPDFTNQFPNMHKLYEGIKHMPTHQERQQQPRKERRAMDAERAELEVQYESKIHPELQVLQQFQAG